MNVGSPNLNLYNGLACRFHLKQYYLVRPGSMVSKISSLLSLIQSELESHIKIPNSQNRQFLQNKTKQTMKERFFYTTNIHPLLLLAAMVALSHLVWLLAGGGCGRGTKRENFLTWDPSDIWSEWCKHKKTQKHDFLFCTVVIFSPCYSLLVNKQN